MLNGDMTSLSSAGTCLATRADEVIFPCDDDPGSGVRRWEQVQKSRRGYGCSKQKASAILEILQNSCVRGESL